MKQIIFITISIFIISFATFAQTSKNTCPTISISNPIDLTLPLIFTAEVSEEVENFKFEYVWTAEGGSIVEGQNTKIVKIIPEQCNNIKAIFTIEGLPENCPNTVSEIAGISDGCLVEDKKTFTPDQLLESFDQFVKFDEFQNLSAKDEKLRLDNLFRQIKDDDNSKALIILKFDKNDSNKKKIKRLQAIAKHFDVRKVNKTRFNFVIYNDEREETIFYVEPLDANLNELLSEDEKNYRIINAVNLEQEIKILFPK